MRLSNILKGWLTTVLGLFILFLVSRSLYNHSITFVWDGIAGIVIGVVLLVAKPTFLEEKFNDLISKYTK